MLGLCFILLLERGPGREHITIQSYMLAMVAGLGALYALALAAAPVREFFDLELLSAGQWFLCLLSVAAGLVLAAVGWRLPYIQELEAPAEPPPEPRPGADGPAAGRPGSPAAPAPTVDAEPGHGRERSATPPQRRTKIVATVGPATRTVESAWRS